MNPKEIMARPKEGKIATLLLQPFQEFVNAESSSGILLLLCTLVALVWANSPWSASYHHLWDEHLAIGLGAFSLNKPLHLWINEGLMALFFFLVGLELKRELLVGELASLRKTILPVIAAIGGATLPALIYLAFNKGLPEAAGWAIPMGTDTAFALGILALLGSRVPGTLKVLLIAFAIFDDIIAVLIIAIFYNSGINWLALALAAALMVSLVIINLIGIRYRVVYILLGLVLWFLIFKSGIHATLAGILLALVIPARARIDAQDFLKNSNALLQEFEKARAPGIGLHMNDQQQAAVRGLETASKEIQSPLQAMEHALHRFVAFIIVPLFVIANAGVDLRTGSLLGNLLSPTSLGVVLGLLVGKQIGITLFSWLAVKMRWTQLPTDVTWLQIYGISWLGAIGFTMSLFIDGLAFADTEPILLNQAKIGILASALISACVGYTILRKACPSGEGQETQRSIPQIAAP